MKYKIQRLTVSEVLNQGIALMRNHFGLLLQIMLILWVPWLVVSGFVQLSMLPQMPPNPTPQDAQRVLQAQLANLPMLLGITFVGVFIILPMTNAAMIYAIAELYLNKPVTAFGAMKKGWTRLGPLIWTTILAGLAIWGGLILCVVPGILFGLWFGLCQHVTVLEGISGSAALGRSKALIRNNLGQFLVLGLIIFAISIAITMGASLIPQVHVQLLVNAVVSAITTIFSTAVIVVFYFSCRCSHENIDLEVLAAAVGETIEPTHEAGLEYADPDGP